MSRARIETLVRRATLVRVAPAVYRVNGAPHTWEAQLHGFVLAAGPGAVAARRAAAGMWACRYVDRETFDVLTLHERRRRRGIGVHRTVFLDDEDVTEREGIPVTTFERTLCDLTTELSYLQLGRAIDDGLRRGVVDMATLRRCAQRLASGPGRRLSVIWPLIDARSGDYDPGGSGSELKVLDVLRDAGLPLPVQQYRVRVDGRTFYLDYAYPDIKGYLEYFGPGHASVSAVTDDGDRFSLLSTEGWKPLVFTEETTPRTMVMRTAKLLGLPAPRFGR
jgi:hypothetical protein